MKSSAMTPPRSRTRARASSLREMFIRSSIVRVANCYCNSSYTRRYARKQPGGYVASNSSGNCSSESITASAASIGGSAVLEARTWIAYMPAAFTDVIPGTVSSTAMQRSGGIESSSAALR